MTPEQLAKYAIEDDDYMTFFSHAFFWKNTKEGFGYWSKVATKFCITMRDYEKSIPTFKMQERKVLVARFINCIDRQPGDTGRMQDLVSKTLQENNIDFDFLVTEETEIKAFKRETSFEKV